MIVYKSENIKPYTESEAFEGLVNSLYNRAKYEATFSYSGRSVAEVCYTTDELTDKQWYVIIIDRHYSYLHRFTTRSDAIQKALDWAQSVKHEE